MTVDPKQEWIDLLHGEEIHINPMDDDMLHLVRHMMDIKRAEADPQHSDADALHELVEHYKEQMMQLQQKRIQQAIVEMGIKAAQQLVQPAQQTAQAIGGAQPLPMPNGLFGGPVSQPPGNPEATNPQIYSGHPENLHGNV